MYYNTTTTIVYYSIERRTIIIIIGRKSPLQYTRQRRRRRLDGPRRSTIVYDNIIILSLRRSKLSDRGDYYRHGRTLWYYYADIIFFILTYLHNMPTTSMTRSNNASNLCAVRVSLLVRTLPRQPRSDIAPRVACVCVCICISMSCKVYNNNNNNNACSVYRDVVFVVVVVVLVDGRSVSAESQSRRIEVLDPGTRQNGRRVPTWDITAV